MQYPGAPPAKRSRTSDEGWTFAGPAIAAPSATQLPAIPPARRPHFVSTSRPTGSSTATSARTQPRAAQHPPAIPKMPPYHPDAVNHQPQRYRQVAMTPVNPLAASQPVEQPQMNGRDGFLPPGAMPFHPQLQLPPHRIATPPPLPPPLRPYTPVSADVVIFDVRGEGFAVGRNFLASDPKCTFYAFHTSEEEVYLDMEPWIFRAMMLFLRWRFGLAQSAPDTPVKFKGLPSSSSKLAEIAFEATVVGLPLLVLVCIRKLFDFTALGHLDRAQATQEVQLLANPKTVSNAYQFLHKLYDQYEKIHVSSSRVAQGNARLFVHTQKTPTVGTPSVVPEEVFRVNFASHAWLLSKVDWSANFIVTGAYLLHCLDPLRQGFGADWLEPIEMYAYGGDLASIKANTTALYDQLTTAYGKSPLVVRDAESISFIFDKHPNVQIHLTTFPNTTLLLHSQNIDSLAVAFDGTTVWVTTRFCLAVNRRANICLPHRSVRDYEYQLWKNSLTGFSTIVPGLHKNHMDGRVYSLPLQLTQGLALLLLLESIDRTQRLSTPTTREMLSYVHNTGIALGLPPILPSYQSVAATLQYLDKLATRAPSPFQWGFSLADIFNKQAFVDNNPDVNLVDSLPASWAVLPWQPRKWPHSPELIWVQMAMDAKSVQYSNATPLFIEQYDLPAIPNEPPTEPQLNGVVTRPSASGPAISSSLAHTPPDPKPDLETAPLLAHSALILSETNGEGLSTDDSRETTSPNGAEPVIILGDSDVIPMDLVDPEDDAASHATQLFQDEDVTDDQDGEQPENTLLDDLPATPDLPVAPPSPLHLQDGEQPENALLDDLPTTPDLPVAPRSPLHLQAREQPENTLLDDLPATLDQPTEPLSPSQSVFQEPPATQAFD